MPYSLVDIYLLLKVKWRHNSEGYAAMIYVIDKEGYLIALGNC
jgi:hypothetical protein